MVAVTVAYEVHIPTNIVMRLGHFFKRFYLQNSLSGNNNNVPVQGFPFQLLSATHKHTRTEP